MRISPDILQQCWFLAGPTASGKTRTALKLAEHLNAEIISLDSMAIYRNMDIGTAKPSPEEQKRVPHHLIDILDPHEDYTVAEYVVAASQCCEDILKRGRTPLFVGGTGLYLRSLLRGVFAGPPADEELRNRMEQECRDFGPELLFARLQTVDPETAERLHPNDTRRVIRALEVYHVTGKPLSVQQNQPPLPVEQRPRHVFALNPPREWLYRRINDRVTKMIECDLVGEVQELIASPKPLSKTARQALGYKEIIDALESGEPLESAFDYIRTRTRQFAKRQCTWFRNLPECRLISMSGEESPSDLAAHILSHANEESRSG
ncbi:MAG: tRNA (adenosine(37)-N6)-dimethylallyltransferase MiaA [Planctomycetaceae bacterium]